MSALPPEDEDGQRAKVVAEARTWLGTPYHHRGRIKGAGVDCGMLLAEVYQACDLIPAIDPAYYAPDWALHKGHERYLEWVERFAHPLNEGAVPSPADIAVFRFGRCWSHGAIVVAWPLLIHAYMGEGVTLADALHSHLGKRDCRLFTPFL